MADPRFPCREGLKETFNLTTFHSGFLKLAILKLVSVRPMHGYALMKDIDRLSDHTWKPSPGSVYPALRELQSSGLIAQEVVGRKRSTASRPRGECARRCRTAYPERHPEPAEPPGLSTAGRVRVTSSYRRPGNAGSGRSRSSPSCCTADRPPGAWIAGAHPLQL